MSQNGSPISSSWTRFLFPATFLGLRSFAQTRPPLRTTQSNASRAFPCSPGSKRGRQIADISSKKHENWSRKTSLVRNHGRGDSRTLDADTCKHVRAVAVDQPGQKTLKQLELSKKAHALSTTSASPPIVTAACWHLCNTASQRSTLTAARWHLCEQATRNSKACRTVSRFRIFLHPFRIHCLYCVNNNRQPQDTEETRSSPCKS